ncbi:hypothetical protein HPB50_015476 [Hyalomma asiaticum]|uniref:Uncharacterized protein n=1 Tax=Hyalomma asiaticum TaxID=266040 RepID=A0ACB7RQ48_HYAAI|nr:hypothetical protein HPB50_015476 [Hyalomma asiaticum]
MDSKEAVFWSSYSAVATPNIKEEIFVQRSAPGRTWFSKTASAELPPITRKQWLIIVLIYSGNFCAALSFSLQAPFFPKQAAEKGATPTEYGLIFSSFYFTIFLIAPAYGKLIAMISPNIMLNGGFTLTCLCVVLFGFINHAPAGTAFVALAFLIRIMEGLGAAAYITASATIIMSEFPGRIGTVLSSLKTAFSVGVIIGPTIGGFLYDMGGYTTPFVVCGSLGFVCSLVTYLVIPSIEDKHDSTPTDLRKFWSGPLIYMYAVAIFGSYVCVGFNQATLEPHLRPFNLSTTVLGLVFMIPGICNGLMTPVWGWLCDKKVNTKLLTSISAFFTLLYLLLVGPVPFFPFGTKLWLVLLSMAFFGIGIGGASICAFMATLEYTLYHGYNCVVPFSLATECRSFTGPALGGVLLQHVGYEWGTVVLFGFESIVAVLVTSVYLREVCCSNFTFGRSTQHSRLLDGDTATNSASCEFTTVSDRVQKAQQQQQRQYGACNGGGPS